jgi:hypothetical protein
VCNSLNIYRAGKVFSINFARNNEAHTLYQTHISIHSTVEEEVECEGMDRIDLAHDKERWWALVKAVMNLRVS